MGGYSYPHVVFGLGVVFYKLCTNRYPWTFTGGLVLDASAMLQKFQKFQTDRDFRGFQDLYNRKTRGTDKTQQAIFDLICQMVRLEPSERPTLEEVITRLAKLKGRRGRRVRPDHAILELIQNN